MMTKKNIGILLLLLGIIGFASYQYMYQPHRDIASEKVDFELTPQALKVALSNNNEENQYPVSYTHLTLPTIYSV